MRFRKSIRICKGIRLNFSGSGVSMSMGVRGASVTLGKTGVYANYGIPGTGLYNRVKIAGGSKSASTRSTNNALKSLPLSSYNITITIDDNGEKYIEIHDPYGWEVSDSSLIAKIKRTDKYKAELERALFEKQEEINSAFLSMIRICKLSEKPVDFAEVRKAYNKLCSSLDSDTIFPLPKPKEEEIRQALLAEAESKISSIFFWTNDAKRRAYVEERLSAQYADAVRLWEEERDKHIAIETEKREVEKNRLEKILRTDIEGIYESIDEVLKNITLPADFAVNYEIVDRTLYLDLDLPEIEDMSSEKANILASGKISIKQKTKKEQAGDYALCVCGMSYFFASLLFNTTPEIDYVAISGYSQRENAKSGSTEDQYIYSILFDRDRFSKLDLRTIDPIESFYLFPHNIKLTESFRLETIDIKSPLVEGYPEKKVSVTNNRKDGVPIPKVTPQVAPSVVDERVELYDSITGDRVYVTIPSTSVVIEITDDDRTIYCLDADTYLDLIKYKNKEGKTCIIVDKKKWQVAVKENAKNETRDNEIALTANLNNQGIELEKQGKIDEAILVYEQNVARKSEGRHAYDRLLVIYRGKKDKNNELRIAKIANSLFPRELKYKKRLDSLMTNQNSINLPTEANVYNSNIKHGEIFEQRILQLPEFDFYYKGVESNAYKDIHKHLEPIWEIQRYFKKLIESAEAAEAKGDYAYAADVYEQIVGEKYWMTAPYDKLIKIYSKAKLYNEEIRVIQLSINHFKLLRAKRREYVMGLAKKYNAIEFFNQRLEGGGKITYYSGAFELYNPFSIVDKWEERLNKKMK